MEDNTFDPDLVLAIFKRAWTKRVLEREKNEGADALDTEARSNGLTGEEHIGSGKASAVTSKKSRPTSANANALKLSSELLRVFVTEAIQRAATIAEVEGVDKIEATHLERILPQLLLDF